jgi:hypothetical protein
VILLFALANARDLPLPYIEATPLPQSGGSKLVALVGGTIVAMDGTEPRRGNVLFVGDTLIGVGDVPVPRGASVVDVTGRWVMPGLVDAHVHVFDERELPLFVAAGVTSIVNMSGSTQTLAWRKEQAEGLFLSPRIWTTGPMIDELGDPLFGTTEAVESEADADRVVRAHASTGYDLVKLHGDLEVGLYDAVMNTARDVHLPVVGHLSERVGLLHAMKQRQATVEHTEELVYSFFNGRLDARRIPVAVDALVRGGAPVTPTLVSMDRLAHMLTDDIDALEARPSNRWLPPLSRANWGRSTNPYRAVHTEADATWFRESLAFQQIVTHALDGAGVPLFAGTDSGWLPYLVHGDALHDELALLVESGLTPAHALAAATRAPGTFYGGDLGPGVLAPRHPADILVLDADPLADVRNTAKIALVVTGGRVYRSNDLEALRTRVARESAEEAPIAEALARRDVPEALRRAGALGDNLDDASARSLAMRLAQLGELGAAREALLLGARAHPGSWGARHLAGRALAEDGRLNEARAELAAALATAPELARPQIAAEMAAIGG